MGEVIVKETQRIKSNLEVRDLILRTEERLAKMPEASFGDNACPLKHTFVDGAYVREMFAPKGLLIATKIHKVNHPYFVLKGDVSVLTEEGVVRIKAPYSGVTLAGTKRLMYIHEDTTWITVHVTKEKDLEKIEEEIIASTFDVLDTHTDVQKLLEGG